MEELDGARVPDVPGPVGNRLQKLDADGVTEYQYNEADELLLRERIPRKTCARVSAELTRQAGYC